MKENAGTEVRAHALNVEGRARAVITGVTDVGLFNEQMIVAVTSQGRLTLTGQGLHVDSLNLEEGTLIAEGKIDAVSYDDHAPKARGVLGRMFK